MNHITHSFHVTQNIQWSHSSADGILHGSSISCCWFLHLSMCMDVCWNQRCPQREGILKASSIGIEVNRNTSKRGLRHTARSGGLRMNSWEGRFFLSRKQSKQPLVQVDPQGTSLRCLFNSCSAALPTWPSSWALCSSRGSSNNTTLASALS